MRLIFFKEQVKRLSTNPLYIVLYSEKYKLIKNDYWIVVTESSITESSLLNRRYWIDPVPPRWVFPATVPTPGKYPPSQYFPKGQSLLTAEGTLRAERKINLPRGSLPKLTIPKLRKPKCTSNQIYLSLSSLAIFTNETEWEERTKLCETSTHRTKINIPHSRPIPSFQIEHPRRNVFSGEQDE